MDEEEIKLCKINSEPETNAHKCVQKQHFSLLFSQLHSEFMFAFEKSIP